MDPDECLRRIRHLIRLTSADQEVQAELAERVDALDEWLSKDGFLPDAWPAAGQLRAVRDLIGNVEAQADDYTRPSAHRAVARRIARRMRNALGERS